MENCLICQHNVTDAPGYCLKCQWPTGFNSKIRSPQIDAAVVNWSAGLYREYLKLVGTNSPPPEAHPHGLETKIQQLSLDLKKLNDACIQERQHFDRNLATLVNEMEFLKTRIPDNSNIAARINNLEEQQVRIAREIATIKAQSPTEPPLLQGMAQLLEFPQRSPDVPAPAIAAIESSAPKVELIPAEQELIRQYNHYPEIPDTIRQGAEDVSGALNRLRDGDTSNTLFAIDRKGNFLVVPRNGFCYLVPNKKRQINSHIHKTVKFIYNCQGYYEDYARLLLLKPAIVREVGVGQWQLNLPGILQFK
jgi:hypothetical protein